MLITRQSLITNKKHTRDIPVTQEQLDVWLAPNPPLIQKVFPNLSDEDREFILTGITPEEWERYMGEENED